MATPSPNHGLSFRRGAHRWLAALFAALLVGSSACSSSSNAVDEDKVAVSPEFEPSDLLGNESFSMAPAPLKRIDSFLAHTPYKRARRSFLSSYYSNGYSAAFGLLSASTKHRVSPRLLLAVLQARRGLVGMSRYPVESPSSVEFAFECGCASAGAGACAYSMGGLDRQFDCLGAQLRAAYDDARLLGKTARGFGKGIVSKTSDGIEVTPFSEATAAIYEISPRVGAGDKSGAWLIWNIFNLYEGASGETLEGVQTTSEHTLIGASCTKNAECDDNYLIGAQCRTFGGQGTCTAPCDTGNACLDTTITGEAGVCVQVGTEKLCLPECDPAKKGECGDFVCTSRKDPSGKTVNACVPGGVT